MNITFELPFAGEVSLKIYDILGKEVCRLIEGWKNTGKYQVKFDAGNLPSGIYFTRLTAGELYQVSKLLLLK
jgi:hypothetical protein